MRMFFLKIVTMSISASWLVLAVLLLRLVLKKAPKWISVLLWGLVALRLLMPFSIESIFSLVPDQLADGQIITNVGDWYIGETDTVEIYEGDDPQAGQTSVGSFVSQEGSLKPAKTVANTVYPTLSWIWVAGVTLMLLYTLISYILLWRRVNTAVQLRKGIFQSENVDSPFVLGIIQPKIYLPFRIQNQTLDYVIAHEQSHIHRKDHWWKPFGFILLAIHWFNPLMWLSYILLCRDIELACDEKVIKQMDNENKANYTEALVVCSIHRRRIAACPLAFGEVGIKERVKSVMNYKKPAFWIIMAAIVCCLVVAVCFLTNPNTAKTPSTETTTPAANDTTTPTLNNTVPRTMTLEDVKMLTLRGMDPTWNDFENFVGRDVGSGLFVMRYDIDDDFYVLVGDGKLTGTPMYAVLRCTYNDASVDIRGGDVQAFIESYATFEGDTFDPVETVVGNRKIYYKNADGTWRTNGHIYQHRLEITGQMPDAVADSTFVYLSNLETISFEQAWRAAGLSSNSADYFSPEEAVLVDWNHEPTAPTVLVNNNYVIKTDRLNGAIAEAILNHHKSGKPDGLLNTESHIILVNEVVSGTPLVGRTNHVREVTVYVYYLNMRFHVQGDRPEEQNRIYGQAAITFTVDEKGIYNLKHFVKPESSVDSGADYNAELKNKFVAASEDIATNEDQYNQQLLDGCWKNVTDYVNMKRAASTAQPGGDPENPILDNTLS